MLIFDLQLQTKLNKLGKTGVVIGFIIGNILLSYFANGGNIEIIKFQEILIAALGLLAVPKNQKIQISEILAEPKLLPETTTRTLEENKETVDRLSSMSETISQMAKEYENAAAAVVTDEEIVKFVEEFRGEVGCFFMVDDLMYLKRISLNHFQMKTLKSLFKSLTCLLTV